MTDETSLSPSPLTFCSVALGSGTHTLKDKDFRNPLSRQVFLIKAISNGQERQFSPKFIITDIDSQT